MITSSRVFGVHHHRARVAICVGIAIVTLGAALPASGAPVQPSITPVAGWSTNGPVYATAIIGDTVYAGGSFTQVRGQGGSQTLARTNLAAFDRVTGAIRTGWSADTNGVVRALDTDGSRLYVGGSFTTLKGVTRQRLGAVDPTTGAVNTQFLANASSHVYALAVLGTRLYAGGAFTVIGGAPRTRLAALATTTGTVDPTFAPVLDNSVRALAAAPDGASVYAGGQFTAIGGVSQSYLGQVSAVTGANTGLVLAHAPTGQVIALDISPTGRQLFAGSMANRAASYNTSTGVREWVQTADGDIQAIRYRAGNVFFGFHDGFANDTTAHLLVADAASGVLEPWKPTINSFFGVWSIAATDDALAIGGEFTIFSGVQTQGVAVLGNTTTDTDPPTPPTAFAVTATSASSVSLSWLPGTDNVGVGGYRVLRNGTEIAYLAATSITDTGLPAGSSFNYAVQTIDQSGNRSAPVTLTAGTDLGLVTAGSTWRYSDHGSDLGTAWRASGYDDSTWAAGPGQLGYGDGDEATIVSYGPDPANRYTTTYFRRHLTVANPASIGAVTLRLLRDDGAVAYLNGVEIARSNMPAGTIGALTRASSTAGSPDESTYFPFTIDPTTFVPGDNVLAVEVHQINLSSSDLSFDAALDATQHRAPPVPTNVHPTAVTGTSVTLAWDGSVDAVGGYRVYRNGTAIGTTTTPSIIDSGLSPLTTYQYGVSAIDDRGIETAASVAVPVTTADAIPPDSPTGLATTSVLWSKVALTWNPAADNVGTTGYDVRRDGALVGSSATTSFIDATVAPASTYSYTVTARDAAGNASAPSVALSVTTPLANDVSAPSTPGSLRTTARTATSVTLAWNASTDDTGVSGYVVTRDGVDLPAVTTLTLPDAGLAPGVTHSYTVRALDAAGNVSAPSAGLVVAPHASIETVFPAGSVWKYTDDGVDRATAWKASAYDDTTWKSGAGQLGYGDGDETTVMYNGGSVVANRFISHYLRRGFDVSDVNALTGVTLSVLRDDGVVVYVNGVEAFRDNMPAGTITSSTFASTGLFGTDESTYFDFVIPPSMLVEGHNVIAVSVHNNSRSGTGDLSFDARLATKY